MKSWRKKTLIVQKSCWQKGSHENPQATQAVASTIDCLPQTGGNVYFLNIKPTQFLEHVEV